MIMEQDGVFNKLADTMLRIDAVWSDDIWYSSIEFSKPFDRLKCYCGSLLFEVLHTGEYETTAQCNQCGRYFIVHSG